MYMVFVCIWSRVYKHSIGSEELFLFAQIIEIKEPEDNEFSK